MVKTEIIDSIVFDLKQSIEDLSSELKQIIEEVNELHQRIKYLEKNK